ncbi:MAG: ACP S-malonyltransferase [Solirubrobacterales bacterium]
MGKTAFLFPGQGSQKVGMGADLLEARPDVFDRYLEQADSVSGLPIRSLCLEGPIEELTATEAAQPALFSVSLGMLDLAREADISPDFVAGHSLGEYTAAVASGAIPADAGIGLVAKRGRLMADIQSERPGSMAAIIGLDADRVAELCESAAEAGTVVPANLNTPSQVVCSGEDAGVLRLIELAEEAGADKAVKLQVGAAFHSELMEPVQAAMAKEMDAVDWADPDVPLCSNASGKLCSTGDDVHDALVAQIASPVLWVDCVRTLTGNGCDKFLELGAGRTLSGLVRQIDAEVETFSADSPKKLSKFVERASA